ncbi:circadian clock protein KaiC [Actimicrobium sp. GrIS 1.19]|uniref:ATPase domain-containing protein n=1 Tax=Actimicrobium sp. GrIS 1.19 TaxID=3071708 RepID=UPI002E0A29B1|nr:circadian clock protein KaiC [Actimicrobium sp. GrIS 1.19]
MNHTKQVNTSIRLSTGVVGCDEILNGGLTAGRSYLIGGVAGAGKTIFSLQWLRAGLALDEKCMYITLCEPGHEMQRNVSGFGWDLAQIEILDLSPNGSDLRESHGDYHMFPPSEVESVPVWSAIYEAVARARPTRLVIDSVTQLRYLATDEYQFRKHILGLVNFLNNSGVTSLLAFDPTVMEQDASVALAVDGVIRLGRNISTGMAIGLRYLEVDKLRGSGFMSGRHPMRIGNSGIEVFPHRIEHTGSLNPGERMISSGITGLDQLLGGGLESGTTTLLTGPTGTGKSTLGTQFLAHYARTDRAVLFTFEEPASFIMARSRGIGAPIDAVVASGALKIVRINPLELYPDEFLANVREAVEVDGCGMVMIDSLRGYQFAMEEFGKPQAHIHNMINYLSRNGVSTLLINEVEHITSTSLKATDLGVSHLADNIVLLRYAEHAGQVIKIVGCLKKRIGNFQPELRQITVGAAGIEISDKLYHLQGILTGVPAFTQRD